MERSLWRGLSPLVLAALAAQSLLVVLGPTIVAIGNDLDASVAVVGQARSITAIVAAGASVAVAARGDVVAVSWLLGGGGVLSVLACALVATAQSLAVFLIAHVLVGLAMALLTSGSFAGVAAFTPDRRSWATGYVAGANGLAWILVNPMAGFFTERFSWRLAQLLPAGIAVAAVITARFAAVVPASTTTIGLLTPLRDASARRWIGSEITAYAAWTSLLTFAGAFFIDHLGVNESTAGWLLAAAAACYVAASTRSGWLAGQLSRRQLVSGAAVVMAGLLPLMLGVGTSVAAAAVLFGAIGVVAGVRTPGSAALGLEQLPGHPTTMMAARTAALQCGYLLGAVIGGAVIAGPGYQALGVALAPIMLLSGWLVRRVNDPLESTPSEGTATP